MVKAPLRWSDVGDVRMPYVELGDRDGPPVLLVPGLADGLGPLSDDKARKAVPDVPAVLGSHRVLLVSHRHPVETGVTTADLAGDLAVFVEQVVGEPCVVSAHSMGGMVAQHLAASRSDLVVGLALSATVPRADPALREVIDRWDDLVTAGCWRRFYEDALEVSFTGSSLLRRRIALKVLGAPSREHLRDRHLALSQACRSHDATGRLGDIDCPTLVLAGDRDPLARIDRAREIVAAIPDAGLTVLEGYAHGFPEQARDRYVDVLAAFLDAVAPRCT